jgi:hypothetical protein
MATIFFRGSSDVNLVLSSFALNPKCSSNHNALLQWGQNPRRFFAVTHYGNPLLQEANIHLL